MSQQLCRLFKNVFIALQWQKIALNLMRTLTRAQSSTCPSSGNYQSDVIYRECDTKASFIIEEIITKIQASGIPQHNLVVLQILHPAPLPVILSACSHSHLGAIRG